MKFELKSGFIPTPFNHERHENSRKRTNTLHHEGHEVNEVDPGSDGRQSGFIHFAVPATNASPLDHARRAAGGKLRETIFCLRGKPGQFRVPPRYPPPELFAGGAADQVVMLAAWAKTGEPASRECAPLCGSRDCGRDNG